MTGIAQALCRGMKPVSRSIPECVDLTEGKTCAAQGKRGAHKDSTRTLLAADDDVVTNDKIVIDIASDSDTGDTCQQHGLNQQKLPFPARAAADPKLSPKTRFSAASTVPSKAGVPPGLMGATPSKQSQAAPAPALQAGLPNSRLSKHIIYREQVSSELYRSCLDMASCKWRSLMAWHIYASSKILLVHYIELDIFSAMQTGFRHAALH